MNEVLCGFQLRENHWAPPEMVLSKSKSPSGGLNLRCTVTAAPRQRRSALQLQCDASLSPSSCHYRRPCPFSARCIVPKHQRNASAGRARHSGARSGGRQARSAPPTSHGISFLEARAADAFAIAVHPAPPPCAVASPSGRGTSPQTRLCLPSAFQWPTRSIGIANLPRRQLLQLRRISPQPISLRFC